MDSYLYVSNKVRYIPKGLKVTLDIIIKLTIETIEVVRELYIYITSSLSVLSVT